MDVVVDRVLGRLLGGLEQRADIDVEADIGEGGGDHLGAAVVPVLAHLDQHARPAALGLGEGLDLALDRREFRVALIGRAVDARERAHLGLVASEYLLHGVRYLPHRCAGARGLDRRRQQVACPPRGLFKRH